MITVGWEDREECYVVRQDNEFIKDSESLYDALKFALAVGDESCDHVTVTALKEKAA